MDDLISRQATVKAIEQHKTAVLEGHKWDEGIEYGYAAAHRHLVDIIEQLPSAQPKPCEDAVSREAVLSMIDTYMNKSVELHYLPTSDGIKKLISILPPAQPERKKGTWTKDASCPFCGFKPWYERDIHTLSFCPNCGADMRGEQDERPNQ